jgi:hypothetical protein
MTPIFALMFLVCIYSSLAWKPPQTTRRFRIYTPTSSSYTNRNQLRTTPSSLSSHSDLFSFSSLVAVGDYAVEIEKATGTEIYGPIMRAGVFIFISGFISAFLAAFIVSKADSWEGTPNCNVNPPNPTLIFTPELFHEPETGLSEEFERGKEAQLVDMSLDKPGSPNAAASTPGRSTETSVPAVAVPGLSGAKNELKDLDL